MLKHLLPVLLLIPTYTFAQEPALLGSIKDGRYISPNGKLTMQLPFKSVDSKHAVKDIVQLKSLNVILDDKNLDLVHRLELGYMDGNLATTIDLRLFQYRNLFNITYPGTAQLIDFDRTDHGHRYLYKQVSENSVRYHYIQIADYRPRLLLLWSDFIHHDEDTPENEDRIINGENKSIVTARKLFESISYER